MSNHPVRGIDERYVAIMNATESVVIELSPEHLARLDELRTERNLSRGQLIGELLDHAKSRRGPRKPDSGRQQPNAWAQVWPGGKA